MVHSGGSIGYLFASIDEQRRGGEGRGKTWNSPIAHSIQVNTSLTEAQWQSLCMGDDRVSDIRPAIRQGSIWNDHPCFKHGTGCSECSLQAGSNGIYMLYREEDSVRVERVASLASAKLWHFCKLVVGPN